MSRMAYLTRLEAMPLAGLRASAVRWLRNRREVASTSYRRLCDDELALHKAALRYQAAGKPHGWVDETWAKWEREAQEQEHPDAK